MNDMHSQSVPDAIAALWGLPVQRTRGPQARLSITELAAAANAIADAEGLEAVTLAKVARSVGLTTTALYRYVDSKSTLVEVMVDHALGSPPRLTARTWRRRVDEWIAALWARYDAHPWLATVRPTSLPRCPSALEWMNELVAQLRKGGVDDPMNTALALDVLVRGFASLHATVTSSDAPPAWLLEQIGRRFGELAAERDDRSVSEELTAAVARLLG